MQYQQMDVFYHCYQYLLVPEKFLVHLKSIQRVVVLLSSVSW